MNTRTSGVLMHISSLPGEFSVGSFGKEAFEFVDFLADCGFSYWQVLPFCMPDDCNSPYKSYSSFGANPYFIDIPTLYKNGLITEKELSDAKQKTPYLCEYDRLCAERFSLLKKTAGRVKNRQKVYDFIEKILNLQRLPSF